MIIDKRKRTTSATIPENRDSMGSVLSEEERKNNTERILLVNSTNDKVPQHLQIISSTSYLYWIKLYTCFVSAMAFFLNREYVIESAKIVDGIGYKASMFRDNYDTDEKALRKKIKRLRKDGKREEADKLDTFPMDRIALSLQNALHMGEIRRVIHECGFELKETVTRATDNTGPFLGDIEESFDQHSFTILEKTITPESFLTTFQDVYEKYKQLKNRSEINTIASQLSRSVIRANQFHVKNLQFLLKLKTYECELAVASSYNTAEHEVIGGSTVKYQSLGMASLPNWNADFVTYSAAGISVMEGIINNSKKDGKIVLDIGQVSVSSVRESIPESWGLGVFAFPLEYILNNYDEYSKTLKQW